MTPSTFSVFEPPRDAGERLFFVGIAVAFGPLALAEVVRRAAWGYPRRTMWDAVGEINRGGGNERWRT